MGHEPGADQGLSAQPEDRPVFARRAAVPHADRAVSLPREQLAQLVYKIINADPPSVSQLNPDVPEQMDAVIRKALEKDLYCATATARSSPGPAAVRYQIPDEGRCAPRRRALRAPAQTGLSPKVRGRDLWEVMRICAWRKVGSDLGLMRGRPDQRFGIVLEGKVEPPSAGGGCWRWGRARFSASRPGSTSSSNKQPLSAVSLDELSYLEVNPAALALASEGKC